MNLIIKLRELLSLLVDSGTFLILYILKNIPVFFIGIFYYTEINIINIIYHKIRDIKLKKCYFLIDILIKKGKNYIGYVSADYSFINYGHIFYF